MRSSKLWYGVLFKDSSITCGASFIPVETRKVLLGHRNGDITSHYSAPELEELLAAANLVCEEKSGTGCAQTESRYRVRR
jgi:hypothetical protein